MIAPRITDPGGNGTEFDTRSAIALSLSGHTIAKSTQTYEQVGEFRAGIKSAGWYTLTDDVTRDYSYFPGLRTPASLLTPQVTLSWHFYASPTQAARIAPAFWASFVPVGLNASNQAKPDSTTTVAVTPIRSSSDPNAPVVADSVKELQVWSSTDGAHWTALVARHSGGWSVSVKNPAKAGYVYLRAEVTGSHGDTSTETVRRAYAVS